MKIKVSSDSTCDLSPELYEKYQIGVLPLSVTLGDITGKDGIDITPDKLYAYVAERGILPTTSAINVAEYESYFQEQLKEYDALIHVNIGSEFSSCHQNACIAAEGNDNIFVINSENLSMGQGLLVLEVAEGAETCETLADIQKLVERIQAMTSRVEMSFVLDRLDYMRKGGRCSMVTALGATLLNIKPCIEVKNGKMIVAKKYRGNLEKCMKHYVEDRIVGRDDILSNRAFVADSGLRDNLTQVLNEIVTEKNVFQEILRSRAGCTVCCHCGENTFGVIFIRK